MWVNPNTRIISDACSYPEEEEDNWCHICEEHTELMTLPQLWQLFGDIPINNDDEIEEDFLCFLSAHIVLMSGIGLMNGVRMVWQ